MHRDTQEAVSVPPKKQFHHIFTNKTTAAGHMSKFFYVIDCETKSNPVGHNDAIPQPATSPGQITQNSQKYWLPPQKHGSLNLAQQLSWKKKWGTLSAKRTRKTS